MSKKLRLKVNGISLNVAELEKNIYFFITKSICPDPNTATCSYGVVADLSDDVKIITRSEMAPIGNTKQLIEKNDRVVEGLKKKRDTIKAKLDSHFAIQKYKL